MIIITLVLAILVNWLMLYYELGLGLFIAVLLQITFISFGLYRKGEMDKEWLIKTILILLVSLPFITRDMMVFKVLTFLALPVLYSLYYVRFTDFQLSSYMMTLLKAMIRPFSKIHLFIADCMDKLFKGREEVKYIVIGVAVTIPFLMVILPLLVSSDLIFKSITVDYLDRIDFTAGFVFRLVFIIVFSSYWYAQQVMPKLIKSSLIVRKESHGNEEAIVLVHTKYHIITLTFLTMINVIYGLYVFIQVKYLFLNSGQLPENVTYAEYAREGFFQLLSVAIINVLVILLLELFNKSGRMNQRLMEVLTLLMTMVMSVSAFYRMHLYEQSYGYTRLRLLVFIFLGFIIVFMILLTLYLVSYSAMFLKLISIFVVLAYIGASWVNIDGYVTQLNIERYYETGDIDIDYLVYLSEDAKKRIFDFREEEPELFMNIVADSYRGDYLLIDEAKEVSLDWREWNMLKH